MASAVAAQSVRATTRFYHPELDALRLLAFLLVILRHMRGVHGFSGRTYLDGGVWAADFLSVERLPDCEPAGHAARASQKDETSRPVLLTIGLAILSYEFFEKRVLLFKKHFEVVHSRPV